MNVVKAIGSGSMSNDKPHFAAHDLKIPPRQPLPGELLFEFYRAADHKFFRCELRDHGQWGVEAQFFDPVDPVIAQTFQDLNDGDRFMRARELAIAWANDMRKTIETYVEAEG